MLASRMASPVSVSSLQAKFNQVKGAENESNTATLAQWLIAQGVLSAYQAKVLLAGQPGPFHYGEYTVYDRIPNGRLQGMFRRCTQRPGSEYCCTFIPARSCKTRNGGRCWWNS